MKTQLDTDNFFQHKAMLIIVNRQFGKMPLYEATRYAWKINKERAREAEIILPILNGIIVGAFVADEWLDATASNFPGREDAPGRFGFIGQEAPDEIQELYVNKRVPEEYRKPGAANPVKYTWS